MFLSKIDAVRVDAVREERRKRDGPTKMRKATAVKKAIFTKKPELEMSPPKQVS